QPSRVKLISFGILGITFGQRIIRGAKVAAQTKQNHYNQHRADGCQPYDDWLRSRSPACAFLFIATCHRQLFNSLKRLGYDLIAYPWSFFWYKLFFGRFFCCQFWTTVKMLSYTLFKPVAIFPNIFNIFMLIIIFSEGFFQGRNRTVEIPHLSAVPSPDCC